jgi:benzodiazapine receptor
MLEKSLGAVIFAAGSLLLGGLSVALAMQLGELSLTAPGLSLPVWFFGLVWTVLYPTLGVATWRVWRHRERSGVTESLVLFGACFLFLLAFPPVTAVAQRQLVTAMMDVIGLSLGCAAAWGYRRVERTAFLWMIPLLSWLPVTTTLKWATL